MNKLQLKQYLQARLKKVNVAIDKNYAKNRGLSGCINTDEGIKVDAYLRGKKKIIEDVILILSESEEF